MSAHDELTTTIVLQQAELDVARQAGITLSDELKKAVKHGAVLSAEVDRLRGELAEALREKDWLDRHYARQIEESVQLRRELDQAQQQFNELSREASAVGRERDELKNQLHQAAMTKVWTNEDGKRFVFVEDLAPALLGTTNSEAGGRP